MPTQTIQPMKYLEEAESVLLRATDPEYHDDAGPSPEQVAAAGLTMRQEWRYAQRELEWAKAVVRRETDRETVPGAVLRLGADGGGPRYFLRDEPIHAGSALYLLTEAGWLPGRFEYSWTPDREMVSRFYFSLPGFRGTYSGDVGVPLPEGARLARPGDIKGR